MEITWVKTPERWNRFVAASPHAAYGHQFGWRRVIQEAYGHDSLYLAATDPTHGIRALLPLFRINRPFFKPEWVSIPFFDQAGILSPDHDTGRRVIEEAASFLAARGQASCP